MNSAFLDRLDAMQAWVRRWRWWIRLASAGILIPLLWPFVSSRWNAQPAKPLSVTLNAITNLDIGLIAPPPEVDNTAAVANALLAVPPDPALAAPASAPEGHEWVPWDQWQKRRGIKSSRPRWQPSTPFFDVTDALTGEWTPERRHHLSEIIRYLGLPGTRTALDRLVRQANRPYCLTNASVPGCLAVLRRGVKTLTARARYQLAERKDFDAAVRDIEAVLHLSEGMIDDGQLIRFLVAIACRSLALQEIWCWPEEFSLTSAQLERLVKLLDEHPFEGRVEWKQAMHGEMGGSRPFLDTLYARTPDGGGFQILAQSQSDEPRPWVLGAVNLMSPLFEDRRTAERLLVLADERTSRLSELSPDELRRLETPLRGREFRPVLGTYWQIWGLPVGDLESTILRSLVLGLRIRVEGDLSATVIALNRYRVDQGRYPEQLSLLAPRYLPETPIDLFAGEPFRYRLDETGGYLLYSVGDDGRDDGGQALSGMSDGVWDSVVRQRRDEPYLEWVLVPKESGGHGGER